MVMMMMMTLLLMLVTLVLWVERYSAAWPTVGDDMYCCIIVMYMKVPAKQLAKSSALASITSLGTLTQSSVVLGVN